MFMLYSYKIVEKNAVFKRRLYSKMFSYKSIQDLYRLHRFLKREYSYMGIPFVHIVCVSVCVSHVKLRTSWSFPWNLAWAFCHWKVAQLLILYFPTFSNSNMADTRTCEMERALETLSFRFWNYAWKEALKNMKHFIRKYFSKCKVWRWWPCDLFIFLFSFWWS
jgi:hypothetical protein